MSAQGTAALAERMAAHRERLSHCVHCGFCLPACPTYLRLGDEADSPRGRLHLMRAVAEGRLDPASNAFQEHIDRCLGCRACETVCPSGVEYGFLLERAREVGREARPPRVVTRLLLAVIRWPVAFRLWMLGSRILRWSGIPGLVVRLLPDRMPFATARLGMAMLAASAPARLDEFPGAVRERSRAGRAGRVAVSGARGRVGVLRGCVQNELFHRVNVATREVLEVNGWEVVDVQEQGCCGALHAHAGALGDARAMARRNVRAFRRAGVDRIAVNSAGCGAAMRDYPHLLEGEEDAGWFAERVQDISELVASEGMNLVQGGELSLRVAYDPPCHLLHAQRVAEPPLRLLGSIPGVEVLAVPNGEECCGGAGIYGITHPELGGRIGGDKVEAVLSTGADVLATGNPGCAMQIGGGLRLAGSTLPVVHPVELLAESYRRGRSDGSPGAGVTDAKEPR